jgi:hypothetical protein
LLIFTKTLEENNPVGKRKKSLWKYYANLYFDKYCCIKGPTSSHVSQYAVFICLFLYWTGEERALNIGLAGEDPLWSALERILFTESDFRILSYTEWFQMAAKLSRCPVPGVPGRARALGTAHHRTRSVVKTSGQDGSGRDALVFDPRDSIWNHSL